MGAGVSTGVSVGAGVSTGVSVGAGVSTGTSAAAAIRLKAMKAQRSRAMNLSERFFMLLPPYLDAGQPAAVNAVVPLLAT